MERWEKPLFFLVSIKGPLAFHIFMQRELCSVDCFLGAKTKKDNLAHRLAHSIHQNHIDILPLLWFGYPCLCYMERFLGYIMSFTAKLFCFLSRHTHIHAHYQMPSLGWSFHLRGNISAGFTKKFSWAVPEDNAKEREIALTLKRKSAPPLAQSLMILMAAFSFALVKACARCSGVF